MTDASEPHRYPQPEIVTTIKEMRQRVRRARQAGKRIGVVPTMGALHAGHVSLVASSVRACNFTVVTIFVNPMQFGPTEDFTKYPRTLEADLETLSVHPVDVVFLPSNEEMYRPGHATVVEVEGLTAPWEGASRPTHFRGVTTIVCKLFHAVEPDVAFFGQKDYQQSVVIRRMTEDLDLPIEIVVCPIVRESDGLALSSRNVYLSADERRRALVLSRSLQRASQLVEQGERDAELVLRYMRDLLAEEPGVAVDYVAVVDPDSLKPVSRIASRAVAVLAARVGTTRLIDNCVLEPK